jgi:hypothetical protein
MKLVIESILAKRGDSLYEIPEEKKLKTKITNETATGINIPGVVASLSTPQGSWLKIGRSGGSFV